MSGPSTTAERPRTDRAGRTSSRDDAKNSQSAGEEPYSPARILIVDDDRAVTALMSQSLVSAGFSVMTAADGVEAVEQCRRFDPDLVLLDIEMPEMDGILACARIRAESENPNLPIVMVTGRDDEKSVNKAIEAGANDFIVKPINWPLFGHRINGYLASGLAADKTETKSHAEHSGLSNATSYFSFPAVDQESGLALF